MTRPDVEKLEQIAGDGNCLFRAFSSIITGCQELHFAIRTLIVSHMVSIQNLLIGRGPDSHPNYASGMIAQTTMIDYIHHSEMDRNGVWGTAIELGVASHLFQTPIYVYDTSHNAHNWTKYFPWQINRQLQQNVNTMSMYFTGNHFNVVTATR